jgi:hypothetical protein
MGGSCRTTKSHSITLGRSCRTIRGSYRNHGRVVPHDEISFDYLRPIVPHNPRVVSKPWAGRTARRDFIRLPEPSRTARPVGHIVTKTTGGRTTRADHRNGTCRFNTYQGSNVFGVRPSLAQAKKGLTPGLPDPSIPTMPERSRERLECGGRSHRLCMFVHRGNIQKLWLRPQHSKRSRQWHGFGVYHRIYEETVDERIQ